MNLFIYFGIHHPSFQTYSKIFLISRFDKEMIRHCYGVLRVNSFGIETLSGGSGRALFPVTALISHSCQPNILHNPKSIAPNSCENENDGKSI